MDHWDIYPKGFLTPDGDLWDPSSNHYADQEAAMLDPNGLIASHEERPSKRLFTEADLGELYTLPLLGISTMIRSI
jgi:hypothetical protein